MQISDDLFNDTLYHYTKFYELDFVIKPSLPILYFGDSKAYFESDFKVITSALNPSDAEFKELKSSNPSYVRFPDYKNSIKTLRLALDNYFKINPYTKWFGKPNISKSGFLPLLNGLGTCYYKESQKNIALHTDICSPLATNPTWSGLNEKQKNILFKSGYELWKSLVIELKPDLILMSLKKDYLKLLPIEFVKQLKSKKSKQSTTRKQLEYTLDHYKLSFGEFQTNLIWGSAQNTPFQPFPNKIDLGKNILNYLKSDLFPR